MFLACIMFVINKYLSNESILALPISLVPFNQSCRKLLSQMYSKLVELVIPCLMRLIFPEFSSLGWLYSRFPNHSKGVLSHRLIKEFTPTQ